MKLVTTLNKYFDVYEHLERGAINHEKQVVDVPNLWVFEKGEDSEPLFILRCARTLKGVDGWIVGNIYSNLEHGQTLSEKQLKEKIKRKEIKSMYSKC